MKSEIYKSYIQDAELIVGNPLPLSSPSLEANDIEDFWTNWGKERIEKGQSFIVEESTVVKRYTFQSLGTFCYAFSSDSYDNQITKLKGLQEELEKIGEVILEGGIDKDGNYIATDILLYDGNDLTDRPLRKRKEILAKVLEGINIKPAEYSIFYHEDCFFKGGQGSGCSGSNCGRPSTGGGSGRFASDPVIHADKLREKISTLKEKFKQRKITPRTYKRNVEPLYALLQRTEQGAKESTSILQTPYEKGKSYLIRPCNSVYYFTSSDDFVLLKGGAGSGCQGPNCGRPSTGGSKQSTGNNKGQNPIPQLDGDRQWIDHAEGQPTNTLKSFTLQDGTLDPQRQELHDSIKSTFLSGVPSVSDDQIPVAIVLMDGPASGKSSLVDAIDKGDFVRVDPDAIKEHLPEFKESVKQGAKDSAVIVHDESSLIARQIQETAVGNKQNIIFDGTGRNAEKYEKMIQGMKDAGYKVDVIMPTIPVEEAKKRAGLRATRTGRVVPESVIDEAYSSMPKNFERIGKIASTFKLYNNLGAKPILVYAHDEQGGTQIYDQAFVEKFKQQAK